MVTSARKYIATKRASQLIRFIDKKVIGNTIITRVIGNTKIEKIKPKLLERLKAQYNGISEFKFYMQDKNDPCLGIFYFYVDYKSERLIDKQMIQDTLVVYQGNFKTNFRFFDKQVIFTYHAIKRLLERSDETLHSNEKQFMKQLTDIGNLVDLDFQSFDLVTEEVINSTKKIQINDLIVVYNISISENETVAPIVQTIYKAGNKSKRNKDIRIYDINNYKDKINKEDSKKINKKEIINGNKQRR